MIYQLETVKFTVYLHAILHTEKGVVTGFWSTVAKTFYQNILKDWWIRIPFTNDAGSFVKVDFLYSWAAFDAFTLPWIRSAWVVCLDRVSKEEWKRKVSRGENVSDSLDSNILKWFVYVGRIGDERQMRRVRCRGWPPCDCINWDR